MNEYPKIQTIYKRNKADRGRIMLNDYSTPEINFLRDAMWSWTEKVNGTNIRIDWDGIDTVTIGGRTDNAQIQASLILELRRLFTVARFKAAYPDQPMTLYGEGYGAKIQKGGGNYLPASVSFVLFDVLVGGWWLRRDDIERVGRFMCVHTVPQIGIGTLHQATDHARTGFKSKWGEFKAEGLVLKPVIEMRDRAGKRIIAKIKYSDFKFEREVVR